MSASTGTPAIVIRDLGKCYTLGRAAPVQERLTERLTLRDRRSRSLTESREIWALRHISVNVAQGEAVGVIGRNGAGKTTLLKVLSRITPPTEGRVELTGRVGALLEVGTGFHPDLTGRENIYLNGAILGMTRAEVRERLDEIVSFAEVSSFVDTPVKRYSSGMYVRLAFAVAAHLEPDVLLIDEVLSIGDAVFQRKSLGRMREAARAGRTVVFVSHDLGAISNLTSRCIYLSDGQVVGDGPTPEIVKAYLRDTAAGWDGLGREGLSRFRRPRPEGAPVSITGISTSASAAGIDTIALGQPVEIDVDLEVARRLDSVTLAVVIKDDQGRRIGVLYSPDSGFLLTADPGSIRIRVRTADLQLSPGRYFVDVGVNQAPGNPAFDVVQDVPLVEVANMGQVVQWADRPWGVVHPSAVEWELA